MTDLIYLHRNTHNTISHSFDEIFYLHISNHQAGSNLHGLKIRYFYKLSQGFETTEIYELFLFLVFGVDKKVVFKILEFPPTE